MQQTIQGGAPYKKFWLTHQVAQQQSIVQPHQLDQQQQFVP